MIHCFTALDQYFLLDSDCGSLFCLDYPAYLVAKNALEKQNPLTEEEAADFRGLGAATVTEIENELDGTGLSAAATGTEGCLATQSIPNAGIIKSMCLNVTHDCNLRCAYCFADEGKYSGERGRMSAKVACDALDFLVKASKNRVHLEVDFFGGEPMMSMDVVKAAVAHGRELERLRGKIFKFTMTTNATLLSDDDLRFLNENMGNLVLSIDGRREVHDAVRQNAAGHGSFDKALAGALKVRAIRGDKEYYIRGTYTKRNLDFSRDAEALADYGFDQISLEPVVLPTEHPLALQWSDLDQIREEYGRLARLYAARLGTEKAFNFFHFNIDLEGGPCEKKRLTGCGAGVEYVAVAVSGDLYPCHQFVGDQNYLMGNIYDGITDPSIGDTFCGVNINTKPDCRACWARYYCSGGCNANAVHYSKDLMQPEKFSCALMRMRTEYALALKSIYPIVN